MATTKAPAKTTTKAPKASAPKAPKAPTPSKIEKEKASYEKLLDARHAMEDAHLAVFHANTQLEAARTIMSSFEQRDAAVEVALENLNEARAAASEATIHFEELKAKSAGRKA